MCGRFASELPPELVARLCSTGSPLSNVALNWNTAPSQSSLHEGSMNLDRPKPPAGQVNDRS